MNIAHIGNVAGIGSVLARFQQPDASVYCFDRETQRLFGGQFVDYNIPGPALRRSLVRKLFLAELKRYDVWHYHYPYTGLKEALEERRNGHKYLKHYHGDDLRAGGRPDNDFCLVSTPDLLQYAPNGVWLPTPIDLNQIAVIHQPSHNQGEKIRIAHYPHYRQYSSTDYYSATLAKISSLNVEIVTISGVPHDEALQIMATCDIVIGKILPHVGWFGKLELEAMALGKPVTAYISDALYEKYRRPPVHRVTKETFYDDLLALVNDEQRRRQLSREGRKYVEQNHDARLVVEKLAGYYGRV